MPPAAPEWPKESRPRWVKHGSTPPECGAIKDVLDGFYDADGTIPCQIDGGLKCFRSAI
jgi:hypothetical protein